MTYKAYITTLKDVRQHPNADRLKLATIFGNQIVVGIDSVEGQRGVYFPSDGQLSLEFAKANDLIRRKDENGDPAGGMFDDNRRVRVQKLRGEPSDGFFIPIQSLEFTGIDLNSLEDGYIFDTINGIKICQKYETLQTVNTKNSISRSDKKIKLKDLYPDFKEHFDTEQLRFMVDKIPVGSKIIITEKVHGCVDGNTEIDTLEFGIMKIKEIVNKKINCHVKTFNLERNEVCYSKIDDWYFYPDDNDWYEIETEDGIKLLITGNNPVWLPQLKCYRKTENLNIGDVLLFV